MITSILLQIKYKLQKKYSSRNTLENNCTEQPSIILALEIKKQISQLGFT